MAQVLKALGPNPENSEACATLARVLERARETLDGMEERSRSRRAMEMDMRYEQTVQRAMSVGRLSSGADSDDGQWSDDGMDDPPAFQRLVTDNSSNNSMGEPFSPPRRPTLRQPFTPLS